MVGLYSLFMKDQNDTCSYRNQDELLMCLELSVRCARNYFDEIVIYVCEHGDKIIDKTLFDRVVVVPYSELTVKWKDKGLWFYAKAYAYQKEAELGNKFCHIDSDVFLLESPHNYLAEYPIGFQSDEHNKQPFYEGIKGILDYFGYCIPKNFYCAGIVYVNELSIINEYIDKLLDIYPKIDQFPLKGSIAHIYEQGLISRVAEAHGNVGVLFSERDVKKHVRKPPVRFVHLWGDAKRNPENMIKVKNRLLSKNYF